MPDIVLYDRTGAAVTYEGVEEIVTDTPDGEKTAKFSYGEVIDGVEISLSMAEGDQSVTVPEGYLVKEATIKKPETLLPENIKKNVVIANVTGTFAGEEKEKMVDLAMVDGDQVVEADEDTVMTKVTVRKPETLVPKNIVEGVDIGGVVGALVLPQLTKLSFSLASGTLQNIQTYRGNDNGYFELDAVVFDENGEMELARVSIGTDTGYKYIYGYDFLKRPDVMPFMPIIHIEGKGFKPSENVQLAKAIYLSDVNVSSVNCEMSGSVYNRYFVGDKYATTIVPFDGYYIPKEIELSAVDGNVEYEYNNYTGDLSFAVPQSDISINIVAVDIPWLHTPELLWDDARKEITIEYIDSNAESTPVICNGETIFLLEDTREGLAEYEVTKKPAEATYGFVLQSDGYYKDGSSGTSYRTSLCRVDFDMKTEETVTLTYVNYGYSSYDYGIISNIDCKLSNSYSTDIDTTSSNVYTTFKSSNSSTAKTITITVPAGKHFIYLKYRRYFSSSSSYYFKFKVSTEVAEKVKYNMIDFFSYGLYQLQIQSIAEGYTPSDIIELELNMVPDIQIKDGVMSVFNLNFAISVNVVIDEESVDVLDCTDVSEMEIDLTQYNLSIEKHSVYIVTTDSDGNTWQSNTVDDDICFAYSPLAEAEFSEIEAVACSGLVEKAYSVGDTKNIAFSDTTIPIVIIGFNHDDLADGSGKAGITFAYGKVYYTAYLTNGTYTYADENWGTFTNMHNALNTHLTSYLPSELSAVIKAVNKRYYSHLTENIENSEHKLWLFAEEELGVDATGFIYKGEGECYEYFTAGKNGYTAYPELIRYDLSGNARKWWLRTKTLSSTSGTCVSVTGLISSDNQGTLDYVLAGFCI